MVIALCPKAADSRVYGHCKKKTSSHGIWPLEQKNNHFYWTGCCEREHCLPEGFPFHQFNITYYSWCIVLVWRLRAVKSRPVLHHCVVIFVWSSGIIECTCMLFTFINGVRSCARGRQWCGIIHYYSWTASIKPMLLFSRAGYASWGLSLSSV